MCGRGEPPRRDKGAVQPEREALSTLRATRHRPSPIWAGATGNVGMLRPDGSFRTQFVGPGVNPIELSDDGRLFVARDFLGDGLYELDPDLIAPPRC